MGRRGTLVAVALLALVGCERGKDADGTVAANEPATAPAASAEAGLAPGTPAGSVESWMADVRTGLEGLPALAASDPKAAQQKALDLYIGRQEYIEMYYGTGRRLGAKADVGDAVAESETRFHDLMRLLGQTPTPPSDSIAAAVERLAHQHEVALERIKASGLPLAPSPDSAAAPAPSASSTGGGDAIPGIAMQAKVARTPEIRAVLDELVEAERSYRSGDADGAMSRVEHAYLEGFEPIEPRLPADRSGAVERLMHLGLRPQIAQRAPAAEVEATFARVGQELIAADHALGDGANFWFTATNSFVIIVREGLEAVLLIASLLAYLGATGAHPRHRRQIWGGMIAGIVASIATWGVARTLLQIGGASRELVEGVTGLVSVAVLLYVSHWLFQKTYVHDWKEYLKHRLGAALTAGSALAMAGLAFAAVYREGFETVLFYQALLFDAGPSAVLAGALPGAVVIAAIGYGIVRAGLRFPIRRVFAVTNGILLYLAFTFLGKGLYNLQEAGIFAPHPIAFLPDHEALRLLLGFFPLAETLGAQALLLALIGGMWLAYRARTSAKTPVKQPAPLGKVLAA